ncbi:asparaginase [Mangrovibacillus cuniculi]|uniref:asparaginase n=1 Tax=Mangrovibacillus cuniculi TaxID=2593652 RepID=A0A7S8CBD1_9BACI|nr:asparaginase [Mangrovibacillus cuniculi]QPC46721.1 asparaginase [Mangrovibacillus cuniculi]
MKKQILLIHTGGTISMQQNEEGSVVPQSTNPLHSENAAIQDLAAYTIEEPFHLPSPHITPKDMLLLKQVILEQVEKTRIDGIVITHGTDTLEETAYFLDLSLSLDIPIVLTGAMRSSNEIGSDGLYNLRSSIKVASSNGARGKGVLVVMNDEIHTAKNVTKTHTSNVSTFQSPQYGPIGIVAKKGSIFHHSPLEREYFPVSSITKKVALLKSYAGMESNMLEILPTVGFDGVVIEALGQGNMPLDAFEGVKLLLRANFPVVVVSRCFNGSAEDIYGYAGGGKQLKDEGAIFATGLNGQKARIKLLAALESTTDLHVLRNWFEKDSDH